MAELIERGRGKWLVRVFLGRDDTTGKRVFQNRTITGTKKQAGDWARERERERDAMGGGAVRALAFVVGGLLNDLERDYRVNGKRIDWCESVVRVHLRPYFGEMPISKVTTDTLTAYIEERRTAKAANATINRELALLKRAFNLAAQADPPKVARVPRIPKLAEDNVRKGFFEDEDYRKLMATIIEPLRPVLAFGYYTGCRRGEILGLQWKQVDLIEGLAVLNPGETKNSEGRIIPLVPELLDLLRLEKARHDNEFPDSPWVFTHDGGQQYQDFKNSWERACKAAGLWDAEKNRATKLFHDLRRSGVRNLLRAGVPEKVAQSVSGHKTRAVFDRYNIVTETDLKDAARKLGAYMTGKRAEEKKAAESSASHTIVTQDEKRPS